MLLGLGAIFLFLIIFFSRNRAISYGLLVLFGLGAFVFLGSLFYLLGHMRTAFKMKYFLIFVKLVLNNELYFFMLDMVLQNCPKDASSGNALGIFVLVLRAHHASSRRYSCTQNCLFAHSNSSDCIFFQMARHVFQYDRWSPRIGLFLGDPTVLPPLINDVRRPQVNSRTQQDCCMSFLLRA
jgi:hypothetical protein